MVALSISLFFKINLHLRPQLRMQSHRAKLHNFTINTAFYMDCCFHTDCLQNVYPLWGGAFIDNVFALTVSHACMFICEKNQCHHDQQSYSEGLPTFRNCNTKNISEALISEFSRQSQRFLKYNVQHDWPETFIKRYFIKPKAYHLLLISSDWKIESGN